MANLLRAGRLLLLDMASTIVFFVLYLLTRNIPLAVGFGIALGFAQIGWEIARRKPIDTMQWVSLVLVVGSGTATLITADPRFVMIKPSVIYGLVGVVMLKPGWLNRYVPPITMALMPDLVFIFGFVWAGLMFFSAALNVVVALNVDVATWATVMPVYGIVSKLVVFLVMYVTLRGIGARRRRANLGLAG